MNKKKSFVFLLVFVFLLQLCAPSGLIIYHTQQSKQITKFGKDYKFAVHISSIYDGKIYYYTASDVYGTQYATVETDESGYSVLVPCENRPKVAPYIYLNPQNTQDFPFQRTVETKCGISYSDIYDIDADIYDIPDDIYMTARMLNLQAQSPYIMVRIYAGEYQTIGLFTKDGQTLEEFLLEYEAKRQSGKAAA